MAELSDLSVAPHRPVREVLADVPWDAWSAPVKLDQHVSSAVRAGVVKIERKDWSDPVPDNGSGYFLDRNGEISTAAHVVLPEDGSKSELTVITDSGAQYPARIVKLDLDRDSAIIKVDGGLPADVKPLSLRLQGAPPANNEQLWLVAYNSFEKSLTVAPGTFEKNTNSGNVDRFIYNLNNGRSACGDAAINRYASEHERYSDSVVQQSHMHALPGNSGGALVNREGRVVASAVKAATDRQGAADQTFATPVAYARALQSARPTYAFSYEPDPDRPGYQILTGIKRTNGVVVMPPFVPSAVGYARSECLPASK